MDPSLFKARASGPLPASLLARASNPSCTARRPLPPKRFLGGPGSALFPLHFASLRSAAAGPSAPGRAKCARPAAELDAAADTARSRFRARFARASKGLARTVPSPRAGICGSCITRASSIPARGARFAPGPRTRRAPARLRRAQRGRATEKGSASRRLFPPSAADVGRAAADGRRAAIFGALAVLVFGSGRHEVAREVVEHDAPAERSEALDGAARADDRAEAARPQCRPFKRFERPAKAKPERFTAASTDSHRRARGVPRTRGPSTPKARAGARWPSFAAPRARPW